MSISTECSRTYVANLTWSEVNEGWRKCLTVSLGAILVALLESISWKFLMCCQILIHSKNNSI